MFGNPTGSLGRAVSQGELIRCAPKYQTDDFPPGRCADPSAGLLYARITRPVLPRSYPNGHAYEHWASARRAHRRTGGLGTKPSPPTRTGRQLPFQSRGFFTSRHSKVAKFKGLGHERVATLAFTLKVCPVTGGTDFQALLFHFKLGELTFELLNARVQAIDLVRGPPGGRAGSGLCRISARSTVMRTFPSLPGLRGSLRRRASDLAASGLGRPAGHPARHRSGSQCSSGPLIVVVGSDRPTERCAALVNERFFRLDGRNWLAAARAARGSPPGRRLTVEATRRADCSPTQTHLPALITLQDCASE